MKEFIKSVLFIIIFLILLNVTTNIFVLKGNGYGSDVTSFYSEKKNSLDVIFFGSSHSYATFSPKIIQKYSNLNSYNFATQQQPIYITYYYMIEALKYQKPKYFVLDIRMLAVDEDYATEGVTRDAIDKMKISLNKINAINVSVKDKNERLSYYFNIIKYHSRYNELSLTEIKKGLLNIGINNKGFIGLPESEDITINNDKYIEYTEQLELSEKNNEYLNKIILLAKQNNIKLILVKAPCTLTENNQAKYNKVFDIAEKEKINYIDYNKLINDLKLSKGDFYDTGHLSENGANKVSKHFAKYLNIINVK